MDILKGVSLTPIKLISNPKGDVMHALKRTDDSFSEFGEAYFSTIHEHVIKGWKKHSKMTLNLIVPFGHIKFVLFDDRSDSDTAGKYFEVELGLQNYQRLTVPPGIWMAFEGMGTGINLLLNIASIVHDPFETIACDLSNINYQWEK
jgi:dTDP-4-dehydrorhamnose 3,5-epimerase